MRTTYANSASLLKMGCLDAYVWTHQGKVDRFDCKESQGVENRFGRRKLPGKGMLLKDGGLYKGGVKNCIGAGLSLSPACGGREGELLRCVRIEAVQASIFGRSTGESVGRTPKLNVNF